VHAPSPVKRSILVVLMVVLSISALIALIGIFSGTISETMGRLLGTVGLTFLFSLTGLLSAIPVERGVVPVLGYAGIAAAAIAWLLGLTLVWGLVQASSPEAFQPFGIATTLAVTLGWAGALLGITARDPRVDRVVGATVTVVALTGLTSIVATLATGRSEGLGKAAAALSVLGILGSFLAPMLLKWARLEGPQVHAPLGALDDGLPPPEE
jgi:hypothetical protein